jgi:hypothetical protein
MFDADQCRVEAEGPPDPPIVDPDPLTTTVAAFVCAGTVRLGSEVGFPVAVLAATGDPVRHAEHLGATFHAGWRPNEGSTPIPFAAASDPSEFTYHQLPFQRDWLDDLTLPRGVRLRDGALVVDLPAGASPEDLSSLLRIGLDDMSYERVARLPDQVRHRVETGRPALVAPRYALAGAGDVGRLVPVDDLFRFGPHDLPKVVAAVALAIASLGLVVGLELPGVDAKRAGADA